ncbi:hypothetical protein ACHQM5_003279 [Ranunculus cassubicifolius]
MNFSQENKQVSYQPTTPKRRRTDDFEGRSREEKAIVRSPTIVYVETPKIIHADEDHFMSLVQQLTGNNATSKSSKFQSNSRNEDQSNSRKKEKSSVLLPRLSNVSDDHLVSKSVEDSDSFYRNLVVDDADLFLSSPPH